KWKKIYPPFDMLLFEGWCVGFKSLEDLKNVYYNNNNINKLPFSSLENVSVINENLKNYEKHWYKYFDIFIHLDVENINYVYEWRWEQEENMKKRNKEKCGMSEEEVRDFVDRYMPS